MKTVVVMAKRTIYIQNPAKLSVGHRALLVEQGGAQVGSIPLEDIWVIILESHQTQMTTAAMSAVVNAGIGIMICGDDHMPNGLMLPLGAHSRHAAIVENQLAMPKPLRKRLWQRIVIAKITNQAKVLSLLGFDSRHVTAIAKEVKSDDSTNREAVAASSYFRTLIDSGSRRDSRYTAALDYGYAVLRAGIGREAVGGGWLVSRGIHHSSDYNAFNLVDDLIEPYRPFVDLLVFSKEMSGELTPQMKAQLASVFEYLADMPDGTVTTIQTAISETLASLRSAVIEGDDRLLRLPGIRPLERGVPE